MEDSQDLDAQKFLAIVSKYDLIQHVQFATHQAQGTLDLVLTRSNVLDRLVISDVTVNEAWTLSDHSFLNFSCDFAVSKNSQRIQVKSRKIKEIDIQAFKGDIMDSDICNQSKYKNCNVALQIYNSELQRILDKHAPEIEFSVNPDQSDWVDTKCQDARRKRRKAERVYKRLKTQEAKDDFKKARKHADVVLTTTHTSYYRKQLQNCEDKKQAYSIVSNLMDRQVAKTLCPTEKPPDVVADELQKYFQEKVHKIYNDIENMSEKHSTCKNETSCPKMPDVLWNEFERVSEDQIKEIIKSLNKKECESDPIPVKVLMECIQEVAPIITFIVNDSLSKGVFPTALKDAVVRPVIKNTSGDVNDYKNYRPISNLPFMSKVIEKTVQLQLVNHLESNNLHASHQSGYRANHSCETATMSIYNDLLCVSDMKNKVVLLLLDLSAAFDTVCHSTLLSKLESKFGVSGLTLNWFSSYLNDRSFSVKIGKSKSNKCHIRIGVPQGSILGPILFILYTKELEAIAQKYGFSVHLYADDTQLYIEFNPLFEDMAVLEDRISKCFNEIKVWMTANRLKLNADKTESLIVQSRNNFSSGAVDKLKVGHLEELSPSPVVKSLGVLFDAYLTFEDHINQVVQSCYTHLRNLQVIGSKLDFPLKRQLVHCLIFSKLDYCNGLLYGLPDYLLKKLQRVQNSCVRFLYGSKAIGRFDSVSPFLKDAHFLPVTYRIDFKVALTVFKCINNIAPLYLSRYLKVKQQPLKILRNDSDYFLLEKPPLPRLKRTERALSFCGPAVWNSLPYSLRTCNDIVNFKKGLKTYLFSQAFADY